MFRGIAGGSKALQSSHQNWDKLFEFVDDAFIAAFLNAAFGATLSTSILFKFSGIRNVTYDKARRAPLFRQSEPSWSGIYCEFSGFVRGVSDLMFYSCGVVCVSTAMTLLWVRTDDAPSSPLNEMETFLEREGEQDDSN